MNEVLALFFLKKPKVKLKTKNKDHPAEFLSQNDSQMREVMPNAF